VPTTATSYTWENVGPGTHLFAVELVNNDHTPLTPPVERTITVTAATPKVRITSPRDVAIVGPGNFTVTIAVENFRLVDSLGQANVPGEGHVHYFLDGNHRQLREFQPSPPPAATFLPPPPRTAGRMSPEASISLPLNL
jgi:hypothetical protein